MQQYLKVRLVGVAVFGVLGHGVFADGISFSPAEGNALTPFTVTIDGFIGTNGPVPVDVNGGGISGSCSTTRPCSFGATMGYFPGKQWVVAQALVNGVNVVVSNFFSVREARAYTSRACGDNGTKVIVSGHDFTRNQTVYVDNYTVQADADGKFVKSITLNTGNFTGAYKIISSDGFHTVTNVINIDPNLVCGEEIGHVSELRGGATARRPGSGQPIPLRPGDPIYPRDEVETKDNGSVVIDFADNSQFVIGTGGKATIDKYIYDPSDNQNDSAVYGFLDGAFRYVSGLLSKDPEPDVHVNTQYGNIGIRGTEFISRHEPCSTTQEVYLIHGQLALKPLYASVTNLVDAPVTIFYDATNVVTSALTQAAYDALVNEMSQTNPVTFASWQVENFGCTNNNPAAEPGADPDGDGQTNYAEFLARTDPNTNSSAFRLIGGARETDGVRLTWQTHGGTTNILQAAPGINGPFTDIGPALAIPGDTDAVTNFLDAGVTTNLPARFYRIRLAL